MATGEDEPIRIRACPVLTDRACGAIEAEQPGQIGIQLEELRKSQSALSRELHAAGMSLQLDRGGAIRSSHSVLQATAQRPDIRGVIAEYGSEFR